MKEIERICQQMRQGFRGAAWHGPAVMEILAGVTAEVAAARPVANAHSIWEIVLHLISTQEVMLDRMRGVSRQLTPEEDWPPVAVQSEADWQAALRRFEDNDARLQEAVSNFSADRLDEPLVQGGTSAYNNFHGYVQHNLYHAAQMGLLKKVLAA